MNSTENRTEKIDTRVLLSILWIVVMVNMLKADILSLYIPGAADEVAKTAGGNIDPFIDVERINYDGTFHHNDHPYPRLEIQHQSLGKYPCRHHHHYVYRLRWLNLSSLYFHSCS
jgi:hypothetical protein